MTARRGESSSPAPLGVTTTDLAIRLGLLSLVGYWSFNVIAPFLTVVLWSAILTVALYSLFEWLAQRLRRPRLAAALITCSA
jgi:predicted PurR-regulated permease PerM